MPETSRKTTGLTSRGLRASRSLVSGGFALAGFLGILLVGSQLLKGQGVETASPAPSVDPTVAGQLTPGATFRASDGIPTSGPSSVVERPGVPPELRDRYWWTPWGYAGSVGTTLQLRVPDGESIVTGGGGFLVSAIVTSADGSTHTQIVIREFDSGGIVRTIDTDLVRVQGLLVEDRLFWAGLDGAGVGNEEASFVDGGVWSADLGGLVDPINILPGGEDLHSFGENVERTLTAVSPTGLTLISRVGGLAKTRSDVIDSQRLLIRAQLDMNAVATTDDIVIGYSEETSAHIFGRRIDEAEALWTFPREKSGLFELEAVFSFGSTVAVGFHQLNSDTNQSVVSVLDVLTGDAREIFAQSYDAETVLHLAPPLSSPGLLALMPGFWEASIQSGEPVSLLDAETGSLLENAFTITPQ